MDTCARMITVKSKDGQKRQRQRHKTFSTFQAKPYFSHKSQNFPTFKSSAHENLMQQIKLTEIIQNYKPRADAFGFAKEMKTNRLVNRQI